MNKQYGLTAPGSDFPAYFNASLIDGQVVLTVRSPRQEDGSCGVLAAMPMDPAMAVEVSIGIRDVANEARSKFNHPGAQVTDAQIKYMVDRFLAWKLPEGFRPDGGISFEPRYNVDNAHGWPEGKHEPSGTNLLDATQAAAMVRHMIEGLPPAE